MGLKCIDPAQGPCQGFAIALAINCLGQGDIEVEPFAIAVAALLLAAAPARAQEDESPQRFAVELKFGPYYPDVDTEPGDGGDTTATTSGDMGGGGVLVAAQGADLDNDLLEKAKSWGLVNWVAPIIDIMMSAVSETVDYQLRKLYDSIDKRDKYIRIMPDLYTADSEMDNVATDNLEALRQAGLANAMKYEEELDRIASLLLDSQEEPDTGQD